MIDADFQGKSRQQEFANADSALRAASKYNPRIYPCPTCGAEGVLTLRDVKRHYQCDACANRDEGMMY